MLVPLIYCGASDIVRPEMFGAKGDGLFDDAPALNKCLEGNRYTFRASQSVDNAGSFKVCYRMYPKNENLPHRQDFCYVKWFV